jgi:hypothetical protein
MNIVNVSTLSLYWMQYCMQPTNQFHWKEPCCDADSYAAGQNIAHTLWNLSVGLPVHKILLLDAVISKAVESVHLSIFVYDLV